MALKFEKTLSYHLMQLGAIARQEALAPLRQIGLHPGDDVVLFWLANRSRLDLEEMRTELALSPIQFTALINRIDGAQLIDHLTDATNDQTKIFLTPKGLSLLEEITQNFKRLDKEIGSMLTEHKSKKLKKLLTKVNNQF